MSMTGRREINGRLRKLGKTDNAEKRRRNGQAAEAFGSLRAGRYCDEAEADGGAYRQALIAVGAKNTDYRSPATSVVTA